MVEGRVVVHRLVVEAVVLQAVVAVVEVGLGKAGVDVRRPRAGQESLDGKGVGCGILVVGGAPQREEALREGFLLYTSPRPRDS